jgi:transposase-like protein
MTTPYGGIRHSRARGTFLWLRCKRCKQGVRVKLRRTAKGVFKAQLPHPTVQHCQRWFEREIRDIQRHSATWIKRTAKQVATLQAQLKKLKAR